MELPGKKKRGAYNEVYGYSERDGMAVVKVTEKDADDRSKWRRQILCNDL